MNNKILVVFIIILIFLSIISAFILLKKSPNEKIQGESEKGDLKREQVKEEASVEEIQVKIESAIKEKLSNSTAL